ncbi:MAG: MBL fold metallo-hydrolase [Actinomyces sp.]|nr:MAG: MBL fold metallo-hydrolase [Actinomyces sp.]
MSVEVTFLGAAGTVTGSRHLVSAGGRRLLVDCGLFQGRKELRRRNWEPLGVDLDTLDGVVLTHAHVDHCGYLPRLVAQGWRGPVHCSVATAELAAIVLPDAGHLQEEEAEHANRHGYSKHDPALPLYTEEDARRCLDLLRVVEEHPVEAVPGMTLRLRPAGHILGARTVHLETGGRRLVFSGDLGRSVHPLLDPPAPIGPADLVVCESTYGDTEHPDVDVEDRMAEAVGDALGRGGVVLVPAFAVDRTEVVLWHLDRLMADGRLPVVPVFVDSPMACAALDVYRRAVRRGADGVRAEIAGTELFRVVDPVPVRTVEQSKALNARRGPMIIVSASGMATGGRVLHHLATRLGDDRNLVLLVGFQAPGTRGDRLRRGERTLRFFGSDHPVVAKVASIALSAHADRSDLLDWLATAHGDPEVAVVHGEAGASAALARAVASTGRRVTVPAHGESLVVA